MRRHEKKETLWVERGAGMLMACLGLAIASAAGMGIYDGVKSSGKPKAFIDADNNVICYTYRDGVSCLPYHDEGTHLEVFQP